MFESSELDAVLYHVNSDDNSIPPDRFVYLIEKGIFLVIQNFNLTFLHDCFCRAFSSFLNWYFFFIFLIQTDIITIRCFDFPKI